MKDRIEIHRTPLLTNREERYTLGMIDKDCFRMMWFTLNRREAVELKRMIDRVLEGDDIKLGIQLEEEFNG